MTALLINSLANNEFQFFVQLQLWTIENHEVTEAVILPNAVIFVFCDYTRIFTQYLTGIEYKLQFILRFQRKKSFGTNLMLHISRALLLTCTYLSIGMHVLVE